MSVYVQYAVLYKKLGNNKQLANFVHAKAYRKKKCNRKIQTQGTVEQREQVRNCTLVKNKIRENNKK